MNAKKKRGFLRNKRVRRWILLFFFLLLLAWLLSLAVLDPDGFAAFFSSGTKTEDPGGTRKASDATESSPERTDTSNVEARPLDLARAALRELRRDPTDRDRYRRFEELFDTLDEASKAALERERKDVHGEMARRFEAQVRDELGRLEMQAWRMGEDGRFHRAEHALTVLHELYPQFTDEAQARYDALRAKLERARGPWIADRRAAFENAIKAGDEGAAYLALRKLVESGHEDSLAAAVALHSNWRALRGPDADALDRQAMARAAASVVSASLSNTEGFDEYEMLDALLALLSRTADGASVRLLGRMHRDLELLGFAFSQRLAALAGEGLETEPLEGLSTWRGQLAITKGKLHFASREDERELRAEDLESATLDALAASLFENYGLGHDLERFALALVFARLGDPGSAKVPLHATEERAADRVAFLRALAG